MANRFGIVGRILSGISALFSLSACLFDSQEKPDGGSWTPVAGVTMYSKVVLDMQKQGDSLYLFTPYSVMVFDKAPVYIPYFPFTGPFIGNYGDRYRVTRDLILGIESDTVLRICDRRDPLAKHYLPVSRIDTGIQILEGARICSLSPRQFAIDVIMRDQTAAILLIDVAAGDLPFNNIGFPDSLFSAKIIPIGHRLMGHMIDWMYDGISHYVIASRNRTYRLSAQGELAPSNLDYAVSDGFRSGPRLMAVAYTSWRDNGLMASDDDGLSWWPLRFESGNSIPCTQKCFSQNGTGALLFIGDQIWNVKSAGDSSYRFAELDNRGLRGSWITGVESNRGKYYVSTLSGLFEKDSAAAVNMERE